MFLFIILRRCRKIRGCRSHPGLRADRRANWATEQLFAGGANITSPGQKQSWSVRFAPWHVALINARTLKIGRSRFCFLSSICTITELESKSRWRKCLVTVGECATEWVAPADPWNAWVWRVVVLRGWAAIILDFLQSRVDSSVNRGWMFLRFIIWKHRYCTVLYSSGGEYLIGQALWAAAAFSQFSFFSFVFGFVI